MNKANIFQKVKLDFSSIESIKEFNTSNESGIYEGINTDNEHVIVFNQQNEGLKVEVLQSNDWWRVHEYDEDGYLCSETYHK